MNAVHAFWRRALGLIAAAAAMASAGPVTLTMPVPVSSSPFTIPAGVGGSTGVLGGGVPFLGPLQGTPMMSDSFTTQGGFAPGVNSATIEEVVNARATGKLRPREWLNAWHTKMEERAFLFSVNHQPYEYVQRTLRAPVMDLPTVNHVLELGALMTYILENVDPNTDAYRQAATEQRRTGAYWATTVAQFEERFSFLGVSVTSGVVTTDLDGEPRTLDITFAAKGDATVPNIFGAPHVGDIVGFYLTKRPSPYGALYDPFGHPVRGPTLQPRSFLQLLPYVSRNGRPPCLYTNTTGSDAPLPGDVDFTEVVRYGQLGSGRWPGDPEPEPLNERLTRLLAAKDGALEVDEHRIGLTIPVGIVSQATARTTPSDEPFYLRSKDALLMQPKLGIQVNCK